MWKLNKSIAKEMLPTQPVDFAIEPWWGVCLVNFTLEEFKVRFLIIIFSHWFKFQGVSVSIKSSVFIRSWVTQISIYVLVGQALGDMELLTFTAFYRNSQKKKRPQLIKSVRRKEIHLWPLILILSRASTEGVWSTLMSLFILMTALKVNCHFYCVYLSTHLLKELVMLVAFTWVPYDKQISCNRLLGRNHSVIVFSLFFFVFFHSLSLSL